jgi:hypothetical protein
MEHLQHARPGRPRLDRLPRLPALATARLLLDELHGEQRPPPRLLWCGRGGLPGGRPSSLAGDPTGGAAGLRALCVHELRRLRVDGRGGGRQQPPPQRDLRQRPRPGAPDELRRDADPPAALDPAASGVCRHRQRLRRRGDPPQLESLRRSHVPHAARGREPDRRRRGPQPGRARGARGGDAAWR